MSLIDLTNQRFGRLRVIKCVGRTAHKLALWRAVCDCGKTTEVSSNSLRTGGTRSCGCLRTEEASQRMTKHGGAKHGDRRTLEYTSWLQMKARCYNKNHHQYADYGGRGIFVCDEWIDSFPAFLAVVGNRPTPRHTLDRFPDNDGPYRRGNVRWATRKEQANNRRPKRWLKKGQAQ